MVTLYESLKGSLIFIEEAGVVESIFVNVATTVGTLFAYLIVF
jgi:hypothetical protein